MERRKSKVEKNKGFYIAVSCCVLVIAIVGYVSWFAGKGEEKSLEEKKITHEEIVKVPNLSESLKVPLSDSNVTKPTTVPIEQKAAPAAKNVIAEDNTPEFSKPVQGKMICGFSGEELVFNKILSDWRTHNGVDFSAKLGEDVLAAADGVVEKVFSDSMGNCVVIDHENGIKSLYANLEQADTELVGKNVVKGDKIGSVGNSALADFSEEAHLHFEIFQLRNQFLLTKHNHYIICIYHIV